MYEIDCVTELVEVMEAVLQPLKLRLGVSEGEGVIETEAVLLPLEHSEGVVVTVAVSLPLGNGVAVNETEGVFVTVEVGEREGDGLPLAVTVPAPLKVPESDEDVVSELKTLGDVL